MNTLRSVLGFITTFVIICAAGEVPALADPPQRKVSPRTIGAVVKQPDAVDGDAVDDPNVKSPTDDCVASSRVLVTYDVVRGSAPLTKTELYYTTDGGDTWRQAKLESDIQNPIAFDAPADGRYGLYIVLHNARSAMPPPEPGMAAHKWVRVDHRPPSVQVLTLTPDEHFDVNREIHIRWSAVDDSFGSRPVSLHYRSQQTKTFQLIADAQPAQGSRRWTVPEKITGRLEFKITAMDCAGNRGEYVADWLVTEGDRIVKNRTSPGEERWNLHDNAALQTASTDKPRVSEKNSDTPLLPDEPDSHGPMLSEFAAKEAKKQYDLGTWHRIRGEYDIAIARYRDALKQNEAMPAARSDLAGLLFLQGMVEEAGQEFQRVLEQDGAYRPALKGMALVQAKQRKYKSAHASLQKLLLLDPEDSEAWLNFGDVCLFMGDSPEARKAWTQASKLKGATTQIRTSAEKRLNTYGKNRQMAGAALDD